MPDPNALAAVLDDLATEHAALDAIVGPLEAARWSTPTPAEGWDVQDQIWHLTFFDTQAVLAVDDPGGFTASVGDLVADIDGWERAVVAEGRTLAPGDLLDRWRAGRAAMVDRFEALEPGARIPWYGPPMSATSFATARLMETWAHGQDVVDGLRTAGLDVARPATARLRHIAHLGVRTRGFSYLVRGREAPEGEVRVELDAPAGSTGPWTWGPADAADVVRGPAVDFCLLVTQRRNLADTALEAHGPLAAEWLSIAQCFAGAPGPGRPPLA
ncbi:MAG: hypothetical protein JWN46_334 [Acidimicrobiales bacterium]|nr:hypothetical protein [Acidimicrobiales bacterium]